MGDRSRDLSVLNYGRSAHALYDAAGRFQQFGVGNTNDKILTVWIVASDFFDLHAVFADRIVGKGTVDIGFALRAISLWVTAGAFPSP